MRTIKTSFKSYALTSAALAQLAQENGVELATLLDPAGEYAYLPYQDPKTKQAALDKDGNELLKRTKSEVTLEHTLDETFAQLQDCSELVKEYLEAITFEQVRIFVLEKFIKKFAALGDYSLEELAKDWKENQSTESGITLSKADYADAAQLFKSFFLQTQLAAGVEEVSAKQLAEGMGAIAAAKFTSAAIARLSANWLKPETVNRLIVRCGNFAELLETGIPNEQGERSLSEEQVEAFQAVSLVWQKNLKAILAPPPAQFDSLTDLI